MSNPLKASIPQDSLKCPLLKLLAWLTLRPNVWSKLTRVLYPLTGIMISSPKTRTLLRNLPTDLQNLSLQIKSSGPDATKPLAVMAHRKKTILCIGNVTAVPWEANFFAMKKFGGEFSSISSHTQRVRVA